LVVIGSNSRRRTISKPSLPVAGAVAGPITVDLLLQFLAQQTDRLGGFRRGDVAAEAGGGVEIAIGIVG
jgi:hypothetical protein